jgi:RND family efflux transporter MFP subunit
VKRLLKILLPVVVLATGIAGAWVLIQARPAVVREERQAPPPVVRVLTVQTRDIPQVVRALGTVEPRTQTTLVAQVGGAIVGASPAFAFGGEFFPDDVLVEIDRRDHELAVTRAQAQIAEARAALAARAARLQELRSGSRPQEVQRAIADVQEAKAVLDNAQAELERMEALYRQELIAAQNRDAARMAFAVARERHRNAEERLALVRAGPREEEIRAAEAAAGQAEAVLATARAALAQARLELARTRVQAPYRGRVRETLANVGQVVAPGTPLARVYATDVVEVRLPVSLRDLAFIDMRAARNAGGEPAAGPEVRLEAEIAGVRRAWRGRIVRTAGEVDPRTRMLHLVVQVHNPDPQAGGGEALPVGLFVDAEIAGRTLTRVVELPRAALRGEDRVLVADQDDRLRFRTVAVVRRTRETVLIERGLVAGERVAVSPMEVVTDGMRVRPLEDGAEVSPRGDRGGGGG